jgi:heat-inducible transcriptional repressor
MLTTRQELILSLIIQNYTNTGNPVGSKKLMEEGIQASSATIRNDMKALEEIGFIQKNHTSSGRVPSIAGYRYYVDHLLTPSQVKQSEVKRIHESLKDNFSEIDDIIRQSAKILSELTSYTAFSLGPELKDRKLTGFRIVPLNDRQVIAIIVTDRGNVESQVFSIPPNVLGADLEKIVKIINDRLVGQPLLSVYQKLRTEIPMILNRYFQSTDNIMEVFDGILGSSFEDKIFVSGRMNLLNYEHIESLDQFKSTYSLVNNQESISKLLVPSDHSISIRIGSELGNELLGNLSLIQANYEIEGHGGGTVALLGPTNMPYSRIFGLLEVFSRELSQTLAEHYRLLN